MGIMLSEACYWHQKWLFADTTLSDNGGDSPSMCQIWWRHDHFN